jgi:hypothetical protein
MIAAELDESFVEGMGEDVVVVGGWLERPVEVGLDLEPGTHTAELEVAHPQLGVGEVSVEAGLVQVVRLLSHGWGPRRQR